MKKIISLFFALPMLLFSLAANAQTVYNMGTSNGQTITTCSGTFVDAGGVTGNYANNLNQRITFCSAGGANPSHIQLDFSRIEIGDDGICFYDGPNTAAPQISCLGAGGQNPPGGPFLIRASAVNPSGCITVTFTSNAATTDNGWTASVSCVASCQTILAELVSATPAVNPPPTGYIDICQGSTVSFTGRGIYPQSGFIYAHSDATSTFEWDFGDGSTATGLNVSHTYTTPCGYYAQLTIRDQFNCPNVNRINQRVRVAGKPRFTGTGTSLGTICAGDTTPITAVVGTVATKTCTFTTPLFSGDSLFLPDGVGTSYPTAINVQTFAPGQTLTSIAGFQGICLNMEHSFMGDLTIRLRCPNMPAPGITLHASGGGSRFLGTPCDNDSQASVRGTVSQYCFTPTATATWTNGPTVAVTSSPPCSVTTGNSLVAGNYAPDQGGAAIVPNPLNSLVGCPLNGQWILTFIDNLAIDNGYLSSWQMNFAPNLFPLVETFTPTIVSQNWLPDPSIISAVGQNISVSPTCAGVRTFRYTATDNFGCSYDTTVTLTVLPRNSPTCRTCNGFAVQPIADASVCANTPVVLNAPTTGGLGQVSSCFTNNTSKVVPNLSTLTPISSPITVSNIVPAVVNATTINSVCVNISHLVDSDLDIYLVAPNGTQIELSTDNGGTGDNYGTTTPAGSSVLFTCFRPTATTPIAGLGAAAAPFVAPAGYLPEGSFASFNGSNTNGVWTLKVADDSGGAAGKLNEWSMSFNNQYNVTYAWARNPVTGTLVTSTNGSVATVTPVTSTTYTVTATDSYGCTDTETARITVSAQLPAPIVTCAGVTGTTVTVEWANVTGANSYTVTSSSGSVGPITTVAGVNSVTISSLVGGVPCTVTVLPVGNCPALPGSDICTPTAICTLALTNPTIVQPTCFGLSNGNVSMTSTGGTPGFSYEINTTPAITNTTGIFTGLAAGNYSVTVTDNNGCTASNAFVMTQPTDLLVAPTSTASTCGTPTGTASANATGGTVPYTYRWNTFPIQQLGATATGLIGGVYIVTVTDNKGCSQTGFTNVAAASNIALTINANEPICSGGNTGTASVLVAGGTPPYAYNWSTTPNQTSPNAIGLIAGVYTCTVTDAALCAITASVVVSQPAPVDGFVPTVAVSCFGGSDGQADANFSGGNPPYTYIWAGGFSGLTRNGLTAGAYTVIVTDATGCRGTATGTVTQPAQLSAIAVETTPVTCFGLSNGIALLTPTGGTAPYTYVWGATAPGAIGTTPNNLPAGIHSVTVTDLKLCPFVTSVTITQPTILAITAVQQTPVTCAGGSNGSATTVVTGGNPGLTYNWDNGLSSSANPNNLNAGTHTVVVTDVKLCSASNTVLITENAAISATAVMTDSVSCFNGTDGAATVTPAGGTAPYIYTWNNANYIGQSPINFSAGTFTVSVTDVYNCRATASVTILQPLRLVASALAVDTVTCNGLATGQALASATGGTLNYHYAWDNSITTDANSSLLAGSHLVTVTDNNGCQATTSVFVLEPQLLTAQGTTLTNVGCNGGSDATATVTPTGGTLPYYYLWDNGITTQNVSGLNVGTHTVLVTDYHGCTAVATVIITQPAVLTVTASQTTQVSCNGGNNGTATATGAGAPPYVTFIWDNDPTNNGSIGVGFSAGQHSVIVTNGNGCTASNTVTITEPLLLTATTTVVANVTCFNGQNGSAVVNPTGGNPPYVGFLWDNGSQLQQPNNLLAGSHTVIVTDSKGCTTIATATISSPTQLTLTVSEISPVTCFGLNNGRGLAVAANGTPGYTYMWAGGFPGATNNQLNGGTHAVVATDANGCTVAGTVIIGQPQIFLATAAQLTAVSCNGLSDGSASAATTGGNTGAYTYTWGTPTLSITNPATGLPVGTHFVTITDSKGCTATASATITQPQPLRVTISVVSQVKCFGASNGFVTTQIIGGTTPFTYNWDNSNAGPNPNDLNAGTHTVTITDARGCATTATTIITQPAAVTATATSNSVTCFGGSNGSASVQPSGGNPPYTYAWNSTPGQANINAVGLPAGTYTCNISDVNGCSTQASTVVTQPSVIVLTTSNIVNVLCYNGRTGAATANATGGTGSFAYRWSDANQQQTATMTGVPDGIYYVTATDANGCSKTASVTITEPLPFVAVANHTNITCNGAGDGTVSALPSGGIAPYAVSWGTPGGATIGLQIGTYTVTITDANGCIATSTTKITEPTAIRVTMSSVDPLCFGRLTGSATASASGGGNGLYTYTWNTFPTQSTAIANQLSAGTYTVTVADGNTCSTTASVTLGQPSELVLTMSQVPLKCFTPLGATSSTGDATVTAGGGTPGYTYAWSNSGSSSNINFLVAGVYTVTVTDRFACTSTATIDVLQPSPIDIQIYATPAQCNGNANGSVTATVSGGTVGLGYGFTWLNATGTIAQGAAALNTLAAGVYTVSISDANGCTNTASAEVLTQTELVLSASVTNTIKCFGTREGAASVTGTGGRRPYVFAWNSLVGAQDSTASNLAAGSYAVTVTDFSGCSATVSVTITQPDELLIRAITPTVVSCKGGQDGTALAIAQGGTGSYIFSWGTTPPQNTDLAVGLVAGVYSVTITDANNCTASGSVTITEPENPISASVLTTNAGCLNSATATATATVFGGTVGASAGYTYQWSSSPVQITPVATGLTIGTYTVTVMDIKGCSATASGSVLQPDRITLYFPTNVAPHCRGGRDGSATVLAAGGVPNYSFQWNTSPQQIGPSASGMTGSQTYTVTATDINGCTGTGTITIAEPAPITLDIETQASGCFGTGTGTAYVQPNGGTPTYTYAWSDAAFGNVNNVTGLIAGIYNVTVTDTYGCSASSSFTVVQSSPMNIRTAGQNVACFGESTGIASAIVTGGLANYTYLWDNLGASTTSSISDLPQGTYRVTVTDKNNCVVSSTVVITEPALLTLTAVPTGVKCYGTQDGQILLQIQGGTTPYVYSYNGGTSFGGNPNLVGVRAGNYNLAVRDANGCIANATTVVNEPVKLVVNAGSDLQIEYEKTIKLEATQIPNVSYQWTSTPTDSAVVRSDSSILRGMPLSDTYYKVVITDQNGCTADDRVFVRVKSIRRVFVANAITPNADNINDVLFVQGGVGTEKVTYLKVYNRWGELIFENKNMAINDPKSGWNGTYKGQFVDPGVFVWFAEVQYSDGQTQVWRGSVDVLK
jgi:gliding motility-associated-like protein